ncbi:MAG: C1 family peptidase [bacterium]|jgi:bleomycin hydrolase|nr:peptidase C1 [candidate division KSB1 bacterium]MDH7558890.1 C1 family peptidase [bacterium]
MKPNWLPVVLGVLLFAGTGSCLAQVAPDTVVYKVTEFQGKERLTLTLDFSTLAKPSSVESFAPLFHLPPLSQGRTGTCWAFAATSFFESELRRLGRAETKLSEMYTVYHEYIEKARRFVREKGDSNFAQGSELNAVIERMKQYGAVPASAYPGRKADQEQHDHSKLEREMADYLQFVKSHELWDEEQVLTHIKMTLNKYLGEPPTTITVGKKRMTPREFLANVLRLPLDEYVSVMSTKPEPFYTKAEYKAPDNWWHSKDYYNAPLDEFYAALKKALERGYTAALAADTSEPGKSGENDVAIVPTFDIPPSYINQDSREFRIYNRTTTDDHAIHAVGYQRIGDHDWFLIKDSGSAAFRGEHKGYFFFRDDYVRLKVLVFMVHKDAIPELLAKFR